MTKASTKYDTNESINSKFRVKLTKKEIYQPKPEAILTTRFPTKRKNSIRIEDFSKLRVQSPLNPQVSY